MFARTELPPSATFAQRATYPFLRSFFHFFLTYMPYAPIRRVNKPDLSGAFLWASSHSNYLCDTVPPGTEGLRPTKFLAKSTLFRFPIKGFLEFCGALPVARAEDFKGQSGQVRSVQNRSTFKVAIAAMEQGWPIAVFPEGVSIVSPGLTLPLKPGVAKLAFAAEESNDFQLNLRIIPVGLEYGSRSRVGSGLTIRYGKPLRLVDYKDLYREKRDAAVQQLMGDLTREMIGVFPHFQDEKKLVLARKLVALGIARTKYPVAQLFLKKEGDEAFWAGLDHRLREFEEATKGRRIPLPAWGHRQAWKELGPGRRFRRGLLIFLGAPLAVVDLANNSIPELCVQTLVEQLAVDETEKMSLRFMVSPVVLSLLYGLQFFFLKKMVFEGALAGAGFGSYALYAVGSFGLWYFCVHWRRQTKRLVSLFYFWLAGVDGRSEAVGCYRNLRHHLSELQDHGRKGS